MKPGMAVFNKERCINILEGLCKKSEESGPAEEADEPVSGEAETQETGRPFSEKLASMMSEQYTGEAHSAELYYGIAAYLADAHLSGLACFFRKQAQEERCHAMQFFDYIAEAGQLIKMGPMEGVKTSYENVQDVARMFLDHEKKVTSKIFAIAEEARNSGDLYTAAWIERFLEEQLEEVRSAEDFSKHVELVGNDGAGLLVLDEKYGRLAQE